MKPKIILLCGTKQSGKSTAANFIMGYYAAQNNVIPNFHFDKNGESFITHGNKKFDFNIESPDKSFHNWLHDIIYPYISNVAFADCLKETSIKLFGLNRDDVYGTDEQKNKLTHIKLSDLNTILDAETYQKYKKNEDCITNREFLEIFGTNICRKIYSNCHINSAIETIKERNSEISIITDCRFENEFVYIKDMNSEFDIFSIKLERQPFQSNAASENGLKNIDNNIYDLVIPDSVDILEKNDIILKKLVKAKFLNRINIKVQNAS